MTIRFDPTTHTLWLSIGDLVGSAAFPGSIHAGPMLRTRAAMGRNIHDVHQTAQQTAKTSYRAEVPIRQHVHIDDYTVYIQGRMDGLYDDGATRVVEEIKSLLLPQEDFARLTLDDYPAYAMQLWLYLHLLSQTYEGPLRGHLVLINLAHDQQTVFVVKPDAAASERHIAQQTRAIVSRFEARQARAARRQQAELHFPFPATRPHQDDLMQQVRLAMQDQSCVLLSAPTGIGKTVAALYPTLDYALHNGLRVFFVTAKTTQQQLAVETLRQLARQGNPFHVVHLRAKEQSCLNDIYYCHESRCEYAKDYAGKLERTNVVDDLLSTSVIGPGQFAEAGQRHQVCPFELSLDVALEADVIVGDYNYVFDPASYLRRFFQDTPYDDCILIIDEAHNLYARSRDYYSPALRQHRVRQLLAHCAQEPAQFFRDFERFFQALEQLFAELHDSALETPSEGGTVLVPPPLEQMANLRRQLEASMIDYVIYRRRIGQEPGGDSLQDFYYAFQRFCDVLTLGGDAFSYLYTHHADEAVFKILCKDASRFLHTRLQGFHSIIAMSATLTPFSFYQDVLGFPEDRTFTVEFPSPFPAENRRILIIPEVTTTYRERQRQAPKVAQIIETIIAQRDGNYCAFFPSFAYLRQVRAYLQVPQHRLIEQTDYMRESERAWVLQRLQCTKDEPVLLLAVQGGIFAEGIDYPGDLLIGAIIVGPGLPRFDTEQELVRDYYEARYESGFAYAYLYPGMNRVIQSAGRVIRSETDVGVIVLIGKRFTYGNYSALLPTHWYKRTPRELIARDYQRTLRQFWDQHNLPGQSDPT